MVVAYDGSVESKEAVIAAADLFGDRPLVIVSVWEPGFAMTTETYADPLGVSHPLPSAQQIATVDRLQREHADLIAGEGARVAREHGSTAEPLPVEDMADVPGAIVAAAEQHEAAAIVVGSRGRGAVKSRLLGSTSQRLLHRAHRPVLIVHAKH